LGEKKIKANWGRGRRSGVVERGEEKEEDQRKNFSTLSHGTEGQGSKSEMKGNSGS